MKKFIKIHIFLEAESFWRVIIEPKISEQIAYQRLEVLICLAELELDDGECVQETDHMGGRVPRALAHRHDKLVAGQQRGGRDKETVGHLKQWKLEQ